MQVVELYGQGYKSKTISRMMGIDDSLVRSWLRKYRKYGESALKPYWRGPKPGPVFQRYQRSENERLFQQAFSVYALTLEPIASIARRFGLDYHSFRYHVTRYHPELVAMREGLKMKTNYQITPSV